jgi:hypothetical protein
MPAQRVGGVVGVLVPVPAAPVLLLDVPVALLPVPVPVAPDVPIVPVVPAVPLRLPDVVPVPLPVMPLVPVAPVPLAPELFQSPLVPEVPLEVPVAPEVPLPELMSLPLLPDEVESCFWPFLCLSDLWVFFVAEFFCGSVSVLCELVDCAATPALTSIAARMSASFVFMDISFLPLLTVLVTARQNSPTLASPAK